MMKETKNDYLTLAAGAMFTIDMFRLGNNPDEWIEPERFIPERFDSQSRY